MRECSKSPFPFMFLLILVMCAFAAFADEPVNQVHQHEPYTVQGVRVRSNIAMPMPTWYGTQVVNMGPALFQEIAPCRFISTLEADHYPYPWGERPFEIDEARSYQLVGRLERDEWTHPCSYVVPADALAVAMRIYTYEPEGDGKIYVSPQAWAAKSGLPLLTFHSGDSIEEEGVMMIRGGGINVASADAKTNLVIDLLGYFIADPDGKGVKGDAGPKGDPGPQGEAGAIGPQGLIGDTGAQGPQGELGATGPIGPQGLKGDTGAQGPQGDPGATGPIGPQGLKGDTGAQGPQGELGATGPIGPQGLKGDTGAQGPQGDPGATGPIGPQGLKGDAGAQGPQGEPGATGPIGPQGLNGETGPQGPAGLTGDTGPQGPQGLKGDTGPQGPIGLTGPQGPKGDPGPQGPMGGGIKAISGVETFPPGGQITINDAAIAADSLIIVNYVNGSRGNACAVEDQGNGWVKLSGSPNKDFRYIVIGD